MTKVWCGGPTGASNPIVTVSDAQGHDAIVWVIGTNGQLYGLYGDSSDASDTTHSALGGASVLTGSAVTLATTKAHQSPIVANGRLIAATDTRVFALRP